MTVKENSDKIAEDSERIAKLEAVIPFIKEDIGEIKDDIKVIMNKFINQRKLKIALYSFFGGLLAVSGFLLKLFIG